MFRAGMGCSPPTTAPRRCCWSPSRRRRTPCARSATSTSAAGASSPRSSAGRAATRRSRSTRRSRRARSPPRARRRRPTSARRRGRGADGGCSGCSPAARWPTRRTILEPSWADRRQRGRRRRRPRDPRPRRGGVHAGPPAPDGRSRRPARDAARRRATRAWAACCSTSCSATARTPIPPAGSPTVLGELGADRPVIAHVCGTPDDPQDARRQEAALRDAGVIVAPTNAAAARLAAEAARVRIAMLTYSVQPRGGVVHALEVSEALARRGHDVELFGARPAGRGAVPARRACRARRAPRAGRRADSTSASQGMLGAYARGPAAAARAGGFDVVHAQDCLSANAALGLRDGASIDHVIRTVHHVDDFRSPSLIECQDRSILAPDGVLCVSRRGSALAGTSACGRCSCANGVDPRRFRPPRDAAERAATGSCARARRPVRGADRRRHRAAQGLDDAARGLRRAVRAGARAAIRCSWSPAARRCSTTATSSCASTRARGELGVDRARARARPARARRARAAATAPPTCSRSRRSRRASGWSRSRRWRAGCRSSPPTSTSSRGFLADGRTRCSRRSATPRRWRRRSCASRATRSCARGWRAAAGRASRRTRGTPRRRRTSAPTRRCCGGRRGA